MLTGILTSITLSHAHNKTGILTYHMLTGILTSITLSHAHNRMVSYNLHHMLILGVYTCYECFETLICVLTACLVLLSSDDDNVVFYCNSVPSFPALWTTAPPHTVCALR